MDNRLNDVKKLQLVPDLPTTPVELGTDHLARLVIDDHADRPEARAAAATATMLARAFAAVRHQSLHNEE